jgi:hypothetical protein
MTKSEWSACIDPQPMLDFLRGKVSDRKLWLFAAGCCRRIWHRLSDARCRQAVEVAEAYADGLAGAEDLARSRKSAWDAWKLPADAAAREVVAADAWGAAAAVTHYASWVTSGPRTGERLVQAGLLRDVAGNRAPGGSRPLAVNPSWLAWRDGLLVSMARHLYQGREFAELPVLTDALEEAGCADPDILNHFRLPGAHVRGCWVLDSLLGKE